MLLLAPALIVCFAVILHVWKMRHIYYASFKISGPPAWPLVGNSLEFIGKDKDPLHVIEKFKNIYGFPMTAWLGTRFMVMVTDPNDYQILLNHPAALSKDGIYEFTAVVTGQGLVSCTNISRWHLHRKLIAPTFNQRILNDFVLTFQEQALILCEKLEQKVGYGVFDVDPLLRRCLLDVVCETAMGVKVNAQSEDSEYLRWIDRICEISIDRMLHIWNNFDFIFKLTKQGKEIEELSKYVADYTDRVIEAKLREHRRNKISKSQENNGPVKRKAFLDHLIEISDETGQFTTAEFRDEVSSFIVAGGDTTATTQGFALMLLGMHPEIQDKVVEELHEIFGESQRAVTPEDVAKMKYLERVIKETLRLFPPGYFLSRLATEDIELHTCTIPKGTGCAVIPFFTHRDPKLWKDPLKFDPDRFLPEEMSKRHPCSWIPFSSGQRNCLGLRFGMMAMKVILSTIIRKYEVFCDCESVDKIKLRPDVLLKVDGGQKIALQLRNKL